MAGLGNFSKTSLETTKTMTGDFVDQELGFDIDNVDVPLVGDAVLDQVEGGPVEGQKIGDDSQGSAVGQGQVPAGQIDGFTLDETFIISDALINLPSMVWGKLPERDPEHIKGFNEQFYKYCLRKDINPFDYFFDEFGMVMAVIPILKSYMDDYKELYSKEAKAKAKHELDKDHEHYVEIEEAKEVKNSGTE